MLDRSARGYIRAGDAAFGRGSPGDGNIQTVPDMDHGLLRGAIGRA